ncbi:MAG: acyltransferase [Armatimonadota bacterium]
MVTKDVPEGAVVAGNPAHIIRWREGYEPEAEDDDTPSAKESNNE